MRRAPLLFAAASAASCIGVVDPLDPEVGEPQVARCTNQDSDPDVEVSYIADIRPIFLAETAQPGCTCHLPGAADPIGLEETGLDLSSYEGLRAGGVNSLGGVVVPGAPCESILWQKISPGPPFGARMPFDGPPFLDADTRRLIADWIAEGARDN